MFIAQLASRIDKKIDQVMIHFLGCVMLYPVRCVRKEDQLSILAVIDAGTRHTVSDIDVYASKRTAVYNSFHEVTGYPADQFTTEYWFPWYDWKSAGIAT